MAIIDTNDNVTAHLDDLASSGITAVGRYYSSRAWKRIPPSEAQAISAAGLDIFVVFEDDGDPKLTKDEGLHHAQIASAQARAIGQPKGSAIYFALEHLPDGYRKRDLKGIVDYVRGLRSGLGDRYKVGIYSDGVVLDGLLEAGLCDFAWVSASRGFEGTADFLASRRWALAQDRHLDQTLFGLSVDYDEADGAFGSFKVAVPAAPPAGGPLVAAVVLDVAAAGTGLGFAGRAAAIAEAEWTFFGGQTRDVDGDTTHRGRSEGEDGCFRRIGRYWTEGTGTHGIDGRDHDQPWSAAFVSWVMRSAGAGDRFRYSTQHSVYIAQGIRDCLNKRAEAGYWTLRLTEATPAVGDLVCWARQDGIDYDHQNRGDYAGHADVVVEIADGFAWIIGGNVGNSVTRRPLKLDAAGRLVGGVVSGETMIALMKNRID